MSIIGRTSASHLTHVKIEGFFKTAAGPKTLVNHNLLRLQSILPTQTTVLKDVCTNLKELTIHRGLDKKFWDNDTDSTSGRTYDERINDIIEKVVVGLPKLQQLYLSNYLFAPPEQQVLQDWGTALRWEKVVKDRNRAVKERLQQLEQ